MRIIEKTAYFTHQSFIFFYESWWTRKINRGQCILSPKDRIYSEFLMTHIIIQGPYISRWWPYILSSRPYVFRQDSVFYQDRILSRTVYFIFQNRLFYYLIHGFFPWELILYYKLQYKATWIRNRFSNQNANSLIFRWIIEIRKSLFTKALWRWIFLGMNFLSKSI